METKRTTSAFIGMLIGLLLGALIITGWHTVSYGQYAANQRASDQCWVDGGEYKNGSCVMPVKSDLQERLERACGDNNGYIMENDPAVYCIDAKHGIYKVGGN